MRFGMICIANAMEHRLTKPNHPWTNGQAEGMSRTIKDLLSNDIIAIITVNQHTLRTTSRQTFMCQVGRY